MLNRLLSRFSLAVKLGTFSVLMILFLLVTATISLRSMSTIGHELKAVAEHDLVLSNTISHLSEMQLEQAVLFERAIRLGEEAANGSRHAFEGFSGARRKFSELARAGSEKLVQARQQVQSIKSETTEAEERAEWEHVFEALGHIDAAHREFQNDAERAIEKIAASAKAAQSAGSDQVSEEQALIDRVASEEDALDHELEALANELMNFTLKAARDAEHHEQQATIMILIVGILATLLSAAMAFALTQAISRPICLVVSALNRLGDGDTTIELRSTGRDEAAKLTEAYEIFRERTIEANAAAEREKEAQAAQLHRAEVISQLTAEFDTDVAELLGSVGDACNELNQTAQSMSAIAEENTNQSAAVSAASEQSAASVQTIASAIEEVSTSIIEIGGQAIQSSKQTSSGRERATRVNEQVLGLKTAATRISEVITLIQAVAEQTNLLALNATIEAARAGEAGKGFAVVASEVKELAGQSAKAAEEISDQIAQIQSEVDGAVSGVEEVAKIITDLESIAVSISTAVEQQGAATGEISQSIQDVSAGTRETTRNISGVSEAAVETGTVATRVVAASEQLSGQSERLRASVGKFLDGVKAA
ncbi:methyl-accepting chemotaxis protein [Roseibium sp. Sym1]|uniref:methyl-accepting chemotaxis protein n=1 Tax=Roseibium sp. Sym1 TaxID=3016006 RepID=UPI0022B50ACC|nr:methyl-accepting chemotaxis protein [Roseibium sp. Sym1]